MKTLTIATDRLKRIRLIVIFSAITVIVCFALLQMRSVYAQDATVSADPVKKHNISFPISTLGNCTSLEECRAYCADPANKEACVNFAKSKGFYKPPQGFGNSRARLVIEKAKIELGCNTEEECKAFCAKEENIQKCAEFAKKYSIENGKKKIINNVVLEKAKTLLGCANEEACKAFCTQSVNREKCSVFAKNAGLLGGMVMIASTSAQSKGFEEIKAIIEQCQKNPNTCRENIATIEARLNKVSDAFCKSNPDKCKELFKQAQEGTKDPKLFMEGIDKKKLETEREIEKKQQDLRKVIQRKELELKKELQQIDEKNEPGSKVQGVAEQSLPALAVKTPSFFEWLFNVFLR